MAGSFFERLFDWGRSRIYPSGADSPSDGSAADGPEQFIEIDDRGSDVTVFAFAGLAAQYAGLPIFEFRGILNRCCQGANLVFVRDVRRLSYHVTPDGEPTGLAFYERQVREAMGRLGARYNVALGTSIGGGAAVYFGSRCGMDQVIAFSPAHPLTVYCGALSQLRTYFNLASLIRSPAVYKEMAIITLGAWICYGRLCRTVGRRGMWPVLEAYAEASPRPRATVFYGARCRPDARQASLFGDHEELKLVPLPCARHNCAGFLKERNELAETILREIEAGREALELRLAHPPT